MGSIKCRSTYNEATKTKYWLLVTIYGILNLVSINSFVIDTSKERWRFIKVLRKELIKDHMSSTSSGLHKHIRKSVREFSGIEKQELPDPLSNK